MVKPKFKKMEQHAGKTAKKDATSAKPPTGFKMDVAMAVANVQHVELRRLLSLDVNRGVQTRSQEYSLCDSMQLYNLLFFLPRSDHYTHNHAALMHCLRALLADPRTAQMTNRLVLRLCKDKRDMGDVLDAILDSAPDVCDEMMTGLCVHAAMQASHHRVIDCLINRPGFNVNKAEGPDGIDCDRILQYAVMVASFAPKVAYNPNMVPVVLRHPLLMPNLRDKDLTGEEVVYRTPLSIADKYYANAEELYGAPKALEKKRAARNVRLLLDDDRVDVHAMDICAVDLGY